MGRRRWTYTGLQSNVVGTLFVSVIFQALKGRTGLSIRIFLSAHVMCVTPEECGDNEIAIAVVGRSEALSIAVKAVK